MEVHETIPWRLRTRKSAENRWDYNLPVSRVSQASLNQASATFEVNKQIYDNNNAMIETNEATIKKLDNEILASDDAIQTYQLAQEKNAITMANGNMEAQATVAKKEWKQALKVIHEHRGVDKLVAYELRVYRPREAVCYDKSSLLKRVPSFSD